MFVAIYESYPPGSHFSGFHRDEITYLSIRADSSVGSFIKQNFEFSGTFAVTNHAITNSFDKFVGKSFAAQITASDESSKSISEAILAGGYLNFLCSSVIKSETSIVSSSGWTIGQNYEVYDPKTFSKGFVLSRLQDIVESIMGCLQKTDGNADTVMYTSAVILSSELSYFLPQLSHGKLRDDVSSFYFVSLSLTNLKF
ncbi:hypothetical protein NHQ30_005127 [Ciborinia camelliae]|nr:hypothetical protein NHQ30_005127 [Ciborinia camelliae]